FFAGPSTLKDLEAFPLAKLHVVHIADGPADLSDPRFELDRRMPGEGKLPLVEFAQFLLAKGFDGPWHVECIQGEDYADDFAAVEERGLREGKGVWEGAAPAGAGHAEETWGFLLGIPGVFEELGEFYAPVTRLWEAGVCTVARV